jgi:PelA/Pel-15E family pectate lyase
MTSKFTLCLLAVTGMAVPCPAAIIGTNPPALPLTAERIATLPAEQQGAWKKYLEHSQRQGQADRTAFFRELKKYGVKDSLLPPGNGSARSIPLRKDPDWYSGPEGLRIADIIVSFQTPAGGWSKNLDMSQHKRGPGEHYATSGHRLHLDASDNDMPRDLSWSYVGTFDNDATSTELRFLAKVIAATGKGQDAPYRKAFLRGIDYVLAAQYPNGGWPQVWPLEGGYHDAITYNDDAMLNLIEFLSEVAEGSHEFAFVAPKTRALASASVQRGIQCILATQIAVDGRRTAWCQQHDPLTLHPTSARNYEMPSQSGGESAKVLIFLMRLGKPSGEIVSAIHSAAAWFEKTQLHDVVFKAAGDGGRELVPSPGAAPLWARYYEIGTDRPIFGDRDKTIHDDVRELSKERRNGYSWFSARPQRALDEYARWRAGFQSDHSH